MAWRKSSPELIAVFDEVVPLSPAVERRKMFGYPAAFAHGNMFMGLHQESFVLRLPEAAREKIVAKHGATIFEPLPGRRMREYVSVPDALLGDRGALKSWIEQSLEYAVTLTPKSSTPKRGNRVGAKRAGTAKRKASPAPRGRGRP